MSFLWLDTIQIVMLHLVCTCVLSDRKKYSRIRGIYYNNEHNHHERKLPEIQKESHLHRVCYVIYASLRHRPDAS
jgi:hypothetical protein